MDRAPHTSTPSSPVFYKRGNQGTERLINLPKSHSKYLATLGFRIRPDSRLCSQAEKTEAPPCHCWGSGAQPPALQRDTPQRKSQVNWPLSFSYRCCLVQRREAFKPQNEKQSGTTLPEVRCSLCGRACACTFRGGPELLFVLGWGSKATRNRYIPETMQAGLLFYK